MTIISVEGFIDTHVHTGPAPFQRIGDTIDVARWCKGSKMAAIIVKSHFESTITKVYHARKEFRVLIYLLALRSIEVLVVSIQPQLSRP